MVLIRGQIQYWKGPQLQLKSRKNIRRMAVPVGFGPRCETLVSIIAVMGCLPHEMAEARLLWYFGIMVS